MYQRSRGSFRIPDQTSRPQASDRNPHPPGRQFTSGAIAPEELTGFQVVDTDDWHAGYLLVTRPPFGPGLASDELDNDQLIPTYELSFVEDAVRLLANTATVVDDVLNRRNTARPPASHTTEPSRGHPFRASSPTDATSPPPPSGATEPPTAPGHPRTR
jgi:hypothetical protein